MKNFKELLVWQKAHLLTLSLYKITKCFPEDEKYGLVSQIKRAACSIAANIAEGCGGNSDTEFARYLQIALGSASELEYHILLAHDLKMIDASNYEKLTNDVVEIKKMLTSFIKKLRADRT
ncbi:MAG: four helix bundle protein [Deltaproteobacteria bacterium]|jgi:four helix bundle protein|nr:four helix bundle protein [Deltaproteobacteria bacterium]